MGFHWLSALVGQGPLSGLFPDSGGFAGLWQFQRQNHWTVENMQSCLTCDFSRVELVALRMHTTRGYGLSKLV